MENAPRLAHIYRTDKYVVPESARAEFLENAAETHAFLKTQAGFVQGMILEHAEGPSTYNFVNFTEFESQEALVQAREAVTSRNKTKGFDPQAFQQRLGIRADIGIYKPVIGM